MPEEKELEEFARKLQEQIMEQAKEVYTETVLEHCQNPRHFHKMEQPDGYGKVTGSCGDTMEMFIQIRGDRISQCAFLAAETLRRALADCLYQQHSGFKKIYRKI